MVIVVPEGNAEDHTRKAEYYDGTFEYLKGLGIMLLSDGFTPSEAVTNAKSDKIIW